MVDAAVDRLGSPRSEGMAAPSKASAAGFRPGEDSSSVADWVRKQASAHGFQLDEAQEAVLPYFQRLFEDLVAAERSAGPLQRFFGGGRRRIKGLYVWGGVGRGKSFLMDCFFAAAPIKRKRRLHFHRFMQDVHHELATLQGQANPLAVVAKRLARTTKLLCLDEFLVTDIGDAMLMRHLLDGLFGEDVVLVTTSNTQPDDLYLNGLQRGQFLPAIDLLKGHLQILKVEGGQDYRLRALERLGVYHSPLSDATELRMQEEFVAIARDEGDANVAVDVEGRQLAARRMATGVAWFDFAELCQKPRGQGDFIELARRFHTVLLSRIPRMFADERDAARRFAWLVDEFYDRRVKLIVSAEAPLEGLLDPTAVGRDLERTLSRLIEMQSHHYLAQPHLG
ncbi:MAG: AFG1 family ATPase [Betaproteobacteria bacterium]|nr:AFG1 family ATPase [Betaproteobacteria bacterium]